MWKLDSVKEMKEARTYNNVMIIAINKFEYQIEYAVSNKAKNDSKYKTAHEEKDVIMFIQI